MIDSEVQQRLEQMELPFNEYGLDPYGVSKKHLGFFLSLMRWMYRNYFSVTTFGIEHIPPRGRVMLVGNHSGGVAIDGAMVVTSLFEEMNPPRLAQGMAEKFLGTIPFVSQWLTRSGQFTGLPENAIHMLENDRVLMVFPEGARGTAKLYKDRHSLVRFGTGFMRLAMQTNTPIVPFAFLGGGEILPTVANLYSLGKLVGAPYIPITPYLLPIPLRVPCQLHYSAPILFEGTGFEEDEIIENNVAQVKERIGKLIEFGRDLRDNTGQVPRPNEVDSLSFPSTIVPPASKDALDAVDTHSASTDTEQGAST